MKVERVSDHVWRLGISLVVFPVHVWLVREGGDEGAGLTLIDAGLPFMAKGILRAIDQLELGPLRRIVLTHGHADHVGAIERVRRAAPVPVFAHRIEIPFMEGKLPYPRRNEASRSVAPGLAQALAEDASGRLERIGGLTPYLTPGHAPGHVVYHHEEDGVLLAGDLFTSRRGRLRRPMAMFTSDMPTAIESARIVERLQPRRLEVCHGGPVFDPARQLAGYLQGRTRPSAAVGAPRT